MMLPSCLMNPLVVILKLHVDLFTSAFLTSFCAVPFHPLTHCALVVRVPFQFLRQAERFPTSASCTFCSFCLECLDLLFPFIKQLYFPPPIISLEGLS